MDREERLKGEYRALIKRLAQLSPEDYIIKIHLNSIKNIERDVRLEEDIKTMGFDEIKKVWFDK